MPKNCFLFYNRIGKKPIFTFDEEFLTNFLIQWALSNDPLSLQLSETVDQEYFFYLTWPKQQRLDHLAQFSLLM